MKHQIFFKGIRLRDLLLVLIALITLAMILSRYFEFKIQKEERTFQLTALKVGKADAIVIRTKDFTMLIDAGYRSDGQKVLDFLQEIGIDRLDYLILTHFDRDHIGGAAQIVQSVDVKRVYVPAYSQNNKEYKKLQAELEKKDLIPVILNQPIQFTLNTADFTIYPALKNNYKRVNDYSMFLSITHGSNRFLLTGDAENRRLKEWMENNASTFRLLKVPHHGKAEKLSSQFFELITPEVAIITCSEERKPDQEVVLALRNQGCRVYMTKDGAITAVSDGKSLLIEQPGAVDKAAYQSFVPTSKK